MSVLTVARDFFTAHLPEKILSEIDLSTLKQQKTSFINEKFSANDSDVIFSVNLNSSKKPEWASRIFFKK